MTAPEPTLSGAVSAFSLPFEGGKLLLRERKLWSLALGSFCLSLLAFGLALGLVYSYAAEIHTFVTDWMPVLEATAWYTWIWIGPGKLFLGVVGALLFLLVAALAVAVAYAAASVLASPIHDALALRVERLATGQVIDETESGVWGLLREGLRSMREELRRFVFFVAVVGALVAVGFVVPGAQVLTGPAIVIFTMLFLPLDYASYTLDRRHLSFADKRRWVLDRKPVMLGFGAAAFLLCAVPGLNLLAMPVLVVAGTLLAVRNS
jgi:CysZ protein